MFIGIEMYFSLVLIISQVLVLYLHLSQASVGCFNLLLQLFYSVQQPLFFLAVQLELLDLSDRVTVAFEQLLKLMLESIDLMVGTS